MDDQPQLSVFEKKRISGTPLSFDSICPSFPHPPRVPPTLAAYLSNVHPTESSAVDESLPTAGVVIPEYSKCVVPLSRVDEEFRHSGWRGHRRRVWDALVACQLPAARLDRFKNCGSQLTAEKSEAGDELRIRGSNCHDRFCAPCGVERGERIARNLATHCKDRRLKFVTLTLRHRASALGPQVRRLLRCWRQLRATSFWRHSVAGGAYVIEIKISAATSMWHVHMHVILESRWLPQRRLSEVWHRVTGDSFVVDVRQVADQARGIAYVTKYVGKPIDGSVYSVPDKVQEYILAVRGVRFCGTFGSWRGVQLERTNADTGEWRSLGLLSTILRKAREGDAASVDLVEALRRRYYQLPTTSELRKDTS
jgi:hypothetical protein